MYLTCAIDWYSRLVAAWRLADDMGAAGAGACVEGALAAHGTPAIPSSDQGSVFNSAAYEGLLVGNGVRQIMDGKARWFDNVIVERWFRSLKTECVRISEYETPAELGRLVAAYVEQYNNARPHQSLGYDTPAEWCHPGLTAAWAAGRRTQAHSRAEISCPNERATLVIRFSCARNLIGRH